MTRFVRDARWCRVDDRVLRFEIEANAFCHQMVRSVVGTLVEVGLGKKKAGEMGFDWSDPSEAFDKVEEEIRELQNATDADNFFEELGDVLSSIADYARQEDANLFGRPVILCIHRQRKCTSRNRSKKSRCGNQYRLVSGWLGRKVLPSKIA